MKKFEIVVMTKKGSIHMAGQTRETRGELDGVQIRRQTVDLSIEGCPVGTYHRVRIHTGSWLPWVNSDMTHAARSLRVIAGAWA